jgi:hypothetical protein
VTPVAGIWTISSEEGAPVITHEGAKWTGDEGYPLALFNEPAAFTDGTARIAFKLIDGSDDFTAGLVFGHNGTSYYYVRYNTKDGNVALWRMDGATRTVIKHGDAHEQLARGEWHQMVLTIDGRRVRAAVDGRLGVEHELEQAPAGRMGLWTKPDATSAFRLVAID